MTYIRINGNLIPATVSGKIADQSWDGRSSKAITLDKPFDEVDEMFVDDVSWEIIHEDIVDDRAVHTAYDNSDYSIRGDITLHVDGSCTVVMGKPTDLEDAYELLYGGDE